MASFTSLILVILSLTLFLSTTLASPTAPVDQITFCKLPYMPVRDSPDDIAHCLRIHSFDLTGCYHIPEGYGKIGQSFEVTQGLSECALFHDDGCGDPPPKEAWYGSRAQNMGQNFESFRCICQNKC